MPDEDREKDSRDEEEQPQERRKTPRVKKPIIVQYHIKDLPGAGVDMSQAKDLSEEGMAFTVSQPLNVKTILEIKMKLPTAEETVELEGEVASCNEIRENIVYAIGVKFVNLQEEQKESLSRFVQSYLNE